MRYILIDKIVNLEKGQRIQTIKGVSLAEEYLADHFPSFPVLPGVFLLQGLVESASWLVRLSENFAHSMILLEQARNVKYKTFLTPGQQIHYTVEVKSLQENMSTFSGSGVCQDKTVVEARFGLRHFNLADGQHALAAVDAEIVESLKQRVQLLTSYVHNTGGSERYDA